MTEIPIVVAFLAGLVSFLSPCVLPLVPGFLSYLGGTTLGEAQTKRAEIFLNSLFFVLGFSIVFSILGVILNTLLEAVAFDAQIWLAKIGGTIIILFGLYLTGLLKIPALEREHKFQVSSKIPSRYLSSILFGSAFAAGWTPCIGPVLGSILALAATAPTAAFYLLLTYSIGLGVPFLLVGLFTSQASDFIRKYARAFYYVKIVFGVLLIILGILAFTQRLTRISNFDSIYNLIL